MKNFETHFDEETISRIEIFISDNAGFRRFENDCLVDNLDILRCGSFCVALANFNEDNLEVEPEHLTRFIVRNIHIEYCDNSIFREIQEGIEFLRNSSGSWKELHDYAQKKLNKKLY